MAKPLTRTSFRHFLFSSRDPLFGPPILALIILLMAKSAPALELKDTIELEIAPALKKEETAPAQAIAERFAGEDAGMTWNYSANPMFQFSYADEKKTASGCDLKLQILNS